MHHPLPYHPQFLVPVVAQAGEASE